MNRAKSRSTPSWRRINRDRFSIQRTNETKKSRESRFLCKGNSGWVWAFDELRVAKYRVKGNQGRRGPLSIHLVDLEVLHGVHLRHYALVFHVMSHEQRGNVDWWVTCPLDEQFRGMILDRSPFSARRTNVDVGDGSWRTILVARSRAWNRATKGQPHVTHISHYILAFIRIYMDCCSRTAFAVTMVCCVSKTIILRKTTRQVWRNFLNSWNRQFRDFVIHESPSNRIVLSTM